VGARRTLLEVLFPKVDEVDIFAMALAMLAVLAASLSAEVMVFLGAYWEALKSNLEAMAWAFGLLILVVAALAVSLALPFTHRDLGVQQVRAGAPRPADRGGKRLLRVRAGGPRRDRHPQIGLSSCMPSAGW